MLKLNWKESAETLPQFIRTVNKGNSFDIDTDFVIRCLLAVSDLGTKFDVDLLRTKTNVSKIQDNFENCCKAIQSTIDFVQKDCWCQSGDLIGGSSTLVPFVYYLFHTKNHDIRNDQLVILRKAFYLFAFTLPFSRYTTRLGNFIRDEMKPRLDKGDEEFPFSRAVSWVAYWGKVNGYNETLLQTNPVLAMHLIQRLSGAKVQYERNSPEIDHIFPRSQLRSHKFDEVMINHFANLWILPLGKNRNKSDKHPAQYLADVDNKQLEEALIDSTLLDYSKYADFIKYRSEKIIRKVKNELQFSDIDFRTS
jgi:hypothetical protein